MVSRLREFVVLDYQLATTRMDAGRRNGDEFCFKVRRRQPSWLSMLSLKRKELRNVASFAAMGWYLVSTSCIEAIQAVLCASLTVLALLYTIQVRCGTSHSNNLERRPLPFLLGIHLL